MQGGVPYIQSLRNQCHTKGSTFYIWHMWNCITLNFVTTLRSVQSRIADIYIFGERAKRARHSQVCSIENRGYIYTRKMVPIIGRASSWVEIILYVR